MAKAIMVQGTASSVGKSLIVAALCRIFRQDGYRAVPFKSQNMALNSFITTEGLEMGRAQVMQAEAAQVEPSVLMNPILLKPTSDSGSQVIVNGIALGNMSAKDYFKRKKNWIPDILNAYHKLEQNSDIIVIEGAGSPAEINLKQDDIVNMGMAKLADAPVLLVGDIDRGGVFASLAGTLLLLEPEEKERVKGLVINKFRGDRSILELGLEQISQITGCPVLGVIPYLSVDLEEEDSLTTRFHRKQKGLLEIAVVQFPRISNFTDFQCLECTKGIALRYVTEPAELGTPDMIILPGSKNVIEDLLWMRQSGLEAAILKQVPQTILFGICGGYQMLGNWLSDPEGQESGTSRELRGMGLLPAKTVFESHKVRTQVEGLLNPQLECLSELAGASYSGYEIHMGRTTAEPDAKVSHFGKLCIENGEPQNRSEGLCRGTVFGTYVHGIFDNQEIVQGLTAALCRRKGIDPSQIEIVDYKQYKEQQFNLLADAVRKNLDIKSIYRMIEN